MASSEQIFVIHTWLVNSCSYHLAIASNSVIRKVCFKMEAQSSSDDIDLVSLDWLQSDGTVSASRRSAT